MFISIISAVIFIAIAIVFGVMSFMNFVTKENELDSKNQDMEMDKYRELQKAVKKYKTKSKVYFIICLIFVLGAIVIPASIHTVDVGEIAVVKRFGEVKGTRESGMHFDFWATNTYQRYNTKVQSFEITTAAYSSDAQTMDIQMTVQYQVMPDKVVDIAKRYGSLEVLQSRIQAIVTEKTKATLSSHKAMSIIEKRSDMSPEIEEHIKNAIGEEYFVNVTAVVITNIDFSDAFEKAVEDKMIAEQNKLKAEYENETKIQKAEADAKAKIVSAEADAKANELLEKSLTDKVLRQKYIDKWDGKLPSTMVGDETSVMIPAN